MSAATVDEQRRRKEEEAWASLRTRQQPKQERSGGSGGGPQVRLERGQGEERAGECPLGAKPKFVKITPGVHVQTRGPILLVKFEVRNERGRRQPSPWFIYRLPGDKRLSWYEGRDGIFGWISRSEQLGFPAEGISRAKEQARALIWAANGELGT